jgi:hypothetical protein
MNEKIRRSLPSSGQAPTAATKNRKPDAALKGAATVGDPFLHQGRLRPPLQTPREISLERSLVSYVVMRWQGVVEKVLHYSSIPSEFLIALIANESGGHESSSRFEPRVCRALTAVAKGDRRAYGEITAEMIADELRETLGAKADAYHAEPLNTEFAHTYGEALSSLTDQLLADLAKSWGLTQIMGYHMVSRQGTCYDLLLPEKNLRVAVELLSKFIEDNALDVRAELDCLFRCWNTGGPYGVTFDAEYVANGLRRMEICREMQGGGTVVPTVSAALKGDSTNKEAA